MDEKDTFRHNHQTVPDTFLGVADAGSVRHIKSKLPATEQQKVPDNYGRIKRCIHFNGCVAIYHSVFNVLDPGNFLLDLPFIYFNGAIFCDYCCVIGGDFGLSVKFRKK